MLAVHLAAATINGYAATPQAAALRVVYNTHARPFVQRVNVVGRYAAVRVGAAMMEGSEVTSPILVEHFSFGWQPLEVLNFSCRLDAHVQGRMAAALMLGMPAPKVDRSKCRREPDVGTLSDVAAVRRLMRGPLVPAVTIEGDWALAGWYGAGGGGDLFRRRRGAWTFVRGTGGVTTAEWMHEFGGAPVAVACKIAPDASCPTSARRP